MPANHQILHRAAAELGHRPGRAAAGAVLVLSLVLFAVATPRADTTEVVVSRTLDSPMGASDFELPGVEDAGIEKLWSEGIDLEEAGDLSAANARYQLIADRLETSAYPYWRMSRNLLHQSMLVPEDDKDEQVRLLELADHTAELGVEIDPRCAECMYWRYRALGRLPTVRGLLSAGRDAKTMAELLNRGIELSLAKGELASNRTLAEFYYSSATFYRMVPDWFWLRWVFGVQGNKQRAVADARKAVALETSRSDYQIELGAALLCLGGSAKRAEPMLAEGLEILRRVQTTAATPATESPDRELAAILIRSPDDACEFSRGGFLNVNSVAKSQK
jgi:hypothetical protein